MQTSLQTTDEVVHDVHIIEPNRCYYYHITISIRYYTRIVRCYKCYHLILCNVYISIDVINLVFLSLIHFYVLANDQSIRPQTSVIRPASVSVSGTIRYRLNGDLSISLSFWLINNNNNICILWFVFLLLECENSAYVDAWWGSWVTLHSFRLMATTPYNVYKIR